MTASLMNISSNLKKSVPWINERADNIKQKGCIFDNTGNEGKCHFSLYVLKFFSLCKKM